MCSGKFKFFIFIFFFSVFQISAQVKLLPKLQYPPKYSLLLKTNPLPILWGPVPGVVPLTAEYRLINEFVVAPHQSSIIGFSFLGKSPLLSIFDPFLGGRSREIMVRGFRFQMAHRFYLNKFSNSLGLGYSDYAPEGLYFGPLFSYSEVRVSTKYANIFDIYRRITHFNANMVTGYQLIWDGFVFDIFTGLGYKENRWYEHFPPTVRPIYPQIGGAYNSNLKFIFGFNFGIAF
jgi:hypothetical protein